MARSHEQALLRRVSFFGAAANLRRSVRGLGDNAPLIRTLTDKFAGHFPKVQLCDEGHIQGRTRPARVNCGPEEPHPPNPHPTARIWPRVSHPGSFLFEERYPF
jgi:hypothetical protein